MAVRQSEGGGIPLISVVWAQEVVLVSFRHCSSQETPLNGGKQETESSPFKDQYLPFSPEPVGAGSLPNKICTFKQTHLTAGKMDVVGFLWGK